MKTILFVLLSLVISLVEAHPLTQGGEMLAIEHLALPEGEAAAAAQLQADFAFLKQAGVVQGDARLYVRQASNLAEALPGRAIIVSDRLAKYSRELRLFVLAHEGSHCRHEDVATRSSMIEEAVSPYASSVEMMVQYRAIEPKLQKMSKDIEFRADREAFMLLKKAGVNVKQAATEFFAEFSNADTKWHPASSARLAAIRKM